MPPTGSVAYFDRQFRAQAARGDFALNAFELEVLPFLHGHILDYGCGLGNLAIAAAQRGCQVTALDASHAAIDALRQRAAGLPVQAMEADLRNYKPTGEFDAVVSIGLLMFFDCATAQQVLKRLQELLRPAGVAAINVLVAGTTWLDALQGGEYCLIDPDELGRSFRDWELLYSDFREIPAPGDTTKAFSTVIARKAA